MNEIVNQLKERISNFSITAMFPSLQYILSEGWNAQTGFVDEESEEQKLLIEASYPMALKATEYLEYCHFSGICLFFS